MDLASSWQIRMALAFGELFQFEGDGADLNGDGFPDGRVNPSTGPYNIGREPYDIWKRLPGATDTQCRN